MRTETPNTIYLKDYAPPAWLVDTVDLHVAIQPGPRREQGPPKNAIRRMAKR